ncbi:MAG: Ig-like domain-containing protein [Myxococcota bacterium]
MRSQRLQGATSSVDDPDRILYYCKILLITEKQTHRLWLGMLVCTWTGAFLPGCGGCGGSSRNEDCIHIDAEVEPPPADVVISEVVLTPRNDWNRSDGVGAPFQARGGGSITSADQFVELRNLEDEPVDLQGWTLLILDSSPSTTTLGDEGPTLVTSAGSNLNALQPGAFLVLGDPDGFASSDAWIILRDERGRWVDDVEIGGLIESRDFEGDGLFDGAPSAERNGFGLGTQDESIARDAASTDTDDDIEDFSLLAATPLAENIASPPRAESVAPEMTFFTTGSRHRVSDEIRVQFTEAVDTLSFDERITVTADGSPVAMDPSVFEYGDTQVILNPVGILPYDATILVSLHRDGIAVSDRAGNALAGRREFDFQTESAPGSESAVRINEICGDPRQDWNDDFGGDGIAFSAVPGVGDVTSDDEWVELLVQADGPIDLTGYTFRIYRGFGTTAPVRAQTRLDTHEFLRIIGSGTRIDALQRGDRIILGDPRSAIGAHSVVELRDSSGVLVDTVELGGNSSATDRGGDGIDNGAPAEGASATSTDLSDESISRVPDGIDTGDDVADFEAGGATLGRPNL